MKAVFEQFGDPAEVLQIVEDDPGKPGAGEVLIEVEAAPINPSDLLTISGEYGQLPALPATPGNEGVGTVIETGSGVDNVAKGDLVMLPMGSGTWRSHMIAKAEGLLVLPHKVNPHQLALLGINPLTAALLLSEIIELQPGDWVIQNAANSSVGHYVVQLAHQRGLHSCNLVRRGGGVELQIKEFGGDAVVVDQGQDLQEAIDYATGGAEIRLALDAVGGAATATLGQCIARGGTIAVYGAMSEEPCQLPPLDLVFRDLHVCGFWLASWFRDSEPAAIAAKYAELIELLETGKLRAEIEGSYPLEKIRDAVRRAQTGGRNGKILITPDTHW